MDPKLSNCLKIALNLVFNENETKILLIQEAKENSRGLWFIPAGKGKIGELISDTCIRETTEEAGVITRPKYLLKTEHIIRKYRFAEEDEINYLDVFRFVFVSEAVAGNVKTVETKDSIKSEWVDLSDVDKLQLRSYEVIQFLEEYQKQKDAKTLRVVSEVLEEFK